MAPALRDRRFALMPQGVIRTAVRLVVCLFCVFCVLTPLGSVAFGQDELTRDQALVYFRGAREAYEAGEFQRSVVLLEEAIELHDVASLHYNLGRALHELARWERARAEYVVFLEMDPDTEERGRVEARIEVLTEMIERQALAEVAETQQTQQTQAPMRASEPRDETPAPWIILGVGVAALGGGVVSGVLSRHSLDEVRDAPDHQSALLVGEVAQRRATIANVLFVSGGVLCATGIVWGLVSRRSSRVEVDVGLSTVHVRGHF